MDAIPTIVLILGIAAVDSINPSALLVTGYLLQRLPANRKTAGVFSYVAGIFCLHLLLGIALLLGLGYILSELQTVFESQPAYVIQAIIGIALFAWSWIPPKPAEESRWRPKNFAFKSLFMLGIVITFVEFITALPYLGAISILQGASMQLDAKLWTLVLYNIVFVLPPLGLLALYLGNRRRFDKWQAKRAVKRSKKPDDTLQWVVGAIGVLLFLNALSELGVGV